MTAPRMQTAPLARCLACLGISSLMVLNSGCHRLSTSTAMPVQTINNPTAQHSNNSAATPTAVTETAQASAEKEATAAENTPIAQKIETASATNPALKMPQQFSVTGKIGVKTPKQSGSAFYAWSQIDDRFAIDLSGALGIGQTRIEGVQGHVTLNSSKTGLVSATEPESLLQQATGWVAPISHLPYWIMALPAKNESIGQLDQQQRLIQLQEDGWAVRFDYANQNTLRPNKLVMTQSNTQGDYKVTLTLQTRQESP